MPQSNAYLLIHVIFSTKDRAPVLVVPARAAMHAYLATVTRDAGCECYRVGGTEDHVHLAIRLSRTITVSGLVEKLKSTSSKWIKEQFHDLDNFAW
jgi:putative transposase